MTTFDYAQFNKKGLKDVVKWLNKQTLPVAEVRGNNVPKRENGFQVKTARIIEPLNLSYRVIARLNIYFLDDDAAVVTKNEQVQAAITA